MEEGKSAKKAIVALYKRGIREELRLWHNCEELRGFQVKYNFV
jgi:hypothetical protein